MTFSPLRYHFQHRAEIETVVQGSGRDTVFDSLTASIGTARAADRTLGGLCDWVEAEAPRPVDLPVEGAASLKAAVIPFTKSRTLSGGRLFWASTVSTIRPVSAVENPRLQRTS